MSVKYSARVHIQLGKVLYFFISPVVLHEQQPALGRAVGDEEHDLPDGLHVGGLHHQVLHGDQRLHSGKHGEFFVDSFLDLELLDLNIKLLLLDGI